MLLACRPDDIDDGGVEGRMIFSFSAVIATSGGQQMLNSCWPQCWLKTIQPVATKAEAGPDRMPAKTSLLPTAASIRMSSDIVLEMMITTLCYTFSLTSVRDCYHVCLDELSGAEGKRISE